MPADIRYLSPEGLHNTPAFTQVVTARGGTTVYVSGQVAWAPDGSVLHPGDLEAQAVRIFENLRIALGAAGASFADVVKFTIYVVGLTPEARATISRVRGRYLTGKPPASTMIGVQALAAPGMVLEIEATAVVG